MNSLATGFTSRRFPGACVQELSWNQADSASLQLSDSAFAAIETEYRSAVSAIWKHAGLAPDSVAAAGVTQEEREQAAARRVDRYLDEAAARKVPLQPVPTFLAVQLLQDVEWEIVPAGIDLALERAGRLLDATENVALVAMPRQPRSLTLSKPFASNWG